MVNGKWNVKREGVGGLLRVGGQPTAINGGRGPTMQIRKQNITETADVE